MQEDPPTCTASSAPPAAAAADGCTMDDDDDDDEDELCRYCFDGDDFGPLISPCNCKGGQKWVHLSCVRRWQRMVLVSQPTHPVHSSPWARVPI